MKLNGKVAWVTGAGSGIGEAAALALAEEGAILVVTGRRKEPLEAVAARIQASGGIVAIEAADLTDASAIDGVVKRIVEKFGRIDLLVNNAGVNIQDRSMDQAQRIGNRHACSEDLTSAFNCARAVLPIMRAQAAAR